MTNETTASQPKSIGDDAQFHDAMMHFLTHATTAKLLRKQPEYLAIAAMVDSRAPAAQASATIQAAPEGWRDKLRWSKANTDYHGLTAFTPDQLEHFVSMLCAPAATIQEPVMVAEPVGFVLPEIAVLQGGKLRRETKYGGNGHNWLLYADNGELIRALNYCEHELVESALAATVKAVPSEALAWVVETGDVSAPLYRTIECGMYEWTSDHMKAIRFARRDDAEMFAAEDSEPIRICQHAWSVAAPLADKTDKM